MDRRHLEVLKVLANNIKKRRKALGLSQEQLAELAELSHNYLAHIETATRSPSAGVITRIADALGVKISELYSEKEEQPLGIGEQIEVMARRLSEEDRKLVLEINIALMQNLLKRYPTSS